MGLAGFATYRRYRTSALVASAAIASGALGMAVPVAHAALLVNESFNYPTLANGANMNGVTATGTGLSGTYSATAPLGLTPGTFAYQTAGLTLGNLAVSGGSVAFETGSSSYTTGSLSAQFSATTNASTLYGSYLFELSKVGSNNGAGALIGPAGATDNNSQVAPLVQEYGEGTNGKVGINNNNPAQVLSGPGLTAGTTYISLFQVSGVGATSGTVSASEWIMDAAQYNYFAGAGNLNASTLNAATTGTGASDVTEAGSVSGTPISGNYPTLNSYLTFWGYSGALTNDTQTFADYRLSDSSLAQAAPVPEPAALGLFAVGGLGLLLLKRRKTA